METLRWLQASKILEPTPVTITDVTPLSASSLKIPATHLDAFCPNQSECLFANSNADLLGSAQIVDMELVWYNSFERK